MTKLVLFCGVAVFVIGVAVVGIRIGIRRVEGWAARMIASAGLPESARNSLDPRLGHEVAPTPARRANIRPCEGFRVVP